MFPVNDVIMKSVEAQFLTFYAQYALCYFIANPFSVLTAPVNLGGHYEYFTCADK